MIVLETNRKTVQYAIGVDLGGTFIKSAIVDSNGRIIKKQKIESFAEKGPDAVTKQIEKSIVELRSLFKKKLSGIGIGAPGIVTDGIVKFPPNFKGWREVNLRKIFSNKLNQDVSIDNDANCAGLAELNFGHGKKYKNFIFLTLGTGIGGAIIIDGKLYRGEQNGAGEFGMTTINYDGVDCLGGNPGSVEAYLGRNYFLQSEANEIRKLGKKIDFNDLSRLAENGKKIAKSVYKRYGFYLGVGLTNYFNLMDVRTAILGGGISNGYKYFINECNKTIKLRSLKTIKNNFRVLKSNIHNDAGILGAAALILENK